MMEESEVISALRIADTRVSSLKDGREYLGTELRVACLLDKNCLFLDGQVTPAIYRIFSMFFDEVVEGGINVPLDNYEKLYQRTATNFSYEIYDLTDEVSRLARKELKNARIAESKVTKDLLTATDKCSGRLEGLDFRIKTLESLSRKIKKEPKAKMRDVLRYTEVSTTKTLFKDYEQTMHLLEEKGYKITAIKNTWNKIESVYKGVNTNIRTPEGYEFELQFHTKESFNLKNGKLHELYEKQRILDKTTDFVEWQAIEDEMFSLSSKLQTPEQIERI